MCTKEKKTLQTVKQVRINNDFRLGILQKVLVLLILEGLWIGENKWHFCFFTWCLFELTKNIW